MEDRDRVVRGVGVGSLDCVAALEAEATQRAGSVRADGDANPNGHLSAAAPTKPDVDANCYGHWDGLAIRYAYRNGDLIAIEYADASYATG